MYCYIVSSTLIKIIVLEVLLKGLEDENRELKHRMIKR
jgi:hypothetical protein